jgi:hypothetical protein
MKNEKYEDLLGYNVFFSDMETECDLFTLTVVFKSGGHSSGRARFEDEYNRRVLNRIRKRVDPKGRYGNNPIYYEHFSRYEYDTCSLKRNVRKHKVHHIHALIPIRKCHAYRVWNKQFSIVDPKLKDSLNAMKKDTVSTWHLEPIKDGELVKWIFYMNKSKDSFEYMTKVVPASDSYQTINKAAEVIRTHEHSTSLSL